METFLASDLGLKISGTILALFCACSLQPNAFAAGDISDHLNTAQASDAATAANKPATKIVTDGTGRRVTIPVNVLRVVSLAPNLTETVYALGLQEKLAGDTSYCDTPAAAKDKPHVGAPANPSLEAIVALHPDLVLAAAINRWETVDALERLGIAVYTIDPHTVRDMLAATAQLGDVMGAPKQSAALVAELQATLDELQSYLREKPLVHVLFVVWEDPLITIGQNTFIADALRWAGAESVIISKNDWPQIGMEEVLRLEPEYIVLISNHSQAGDEDQVRELQNRPIWNQVEAVKLGRIVVATEELIRPSPGLIGQIVQLARALHAGLGAPGAQSSRLKNRIKNSEAERLVACAR